MSVVVTLWVPGQPAPKGSMKAFKSAKMRFAVLTEDNAHTKPWMSVITLAAREAGAVALDGACVVGLRFHLQRPRGHFDEAGALRWNAPRWPTAKPDIDKLTRSVLDALKGVAFTDDARVVGLDPAPYKVFATERGPGLELTVREIDDPAPVKPVRPKKEKPPKPPKQIKVRPAKVVKKPKGATPALEETGW